MKPPAKTNGKFKPFLCGMISGVLAYIIYLEFLAVDELTATGLGWIFFAPQYLVVWVCPAPTVSGVIACYVLIALLYGYIFLSFRLAHRVAIGAFLISGSAFPAFVHWHHAIHEIPGIVLTLLFWPASVLGDVFTDIGISSHILRTAVQSLTVGLWYAAVISGVDTFFLLIKRKQPVADATNPASSIIVACSKCHQHLRVARSQKDLQIRCPVCQFTFLPHR